MDFTNAADPRLRRIPSPAEMIAQFRQGIAALMTPPPGARVDIGGGGMDDQTWYIDVDYRIKNQFVARVRTIRELTPLPKHGAPGDVLRSALIEFSTNAVMAVMPSAADPKQSRGSQVTAQQEQLAARGVAGDSEITIDGTSQPVVTLQIPGYRAHLARRGQGAVIYIGGDSVPIPDLKMTTTPDS